MPSRNHSHIIALSLSFSLSLTLASLQFLCSTPALGYSDPAFDLGRARMMTGDYDGAITALGESLGLNSNNARALVLRGECFFKMGNFKLAIQDLTSALQYSPNNIRALILRGVSHCSLGKDGMALLDFQAALKLNDKLAESYFNRITGGGISALEKLESLQSGQHPDYGSDAGTDIPDDEAGINVHAIKDFREAKKLFKEQQERKAQAQAQAQAQQQMQANGQGRTPDNSLTGAAGGADTSTTGGRAGKRGRNTGIAETPGSDNGDFGAQGATDYGESAPTSDEKSNSNRKALVKKNLIGDPRKSADPGNRLPYIFKDAQNNADVDSDDTIARSRNERFTPNLDQDPMRGEFGLLSGAGEFPGDPKQAILDYSQAIKLDPTNAEYYYRRAKAYQKLTKVNEAMGDFNHAILQDPQQGKYYVGRASLYYQLGRSVLMDADIVAARNCNPDLPAEIHFNLDKLPPGTQWAGDGARD